MSISNIRKWPSYKWISKTGMISAELQGQGHCSNTPHLCGRVLGNVLNGRVAQRHHTAKAQGQSWRHLAKCGMKGTANKPRDPKASIDMT